MDEDGVGPVCLANLGRDRCAVPSEHLSADMTLIIVNYLIYKVFPFSLIKTYYFSEIAIAAVRLQKQIANQNFISFYRLLTMYGRAPLLLILLYRIRLVSTLVRFSYSQPISLSSLSMWSSLSFMSPFPCGLGVYRGTLSSLESDCHVCRVSCASQDHRFLRHRLYPVLGGITLNLEVYKKMYIYIHFLHEYLFYCKS